jgi:hypothetical protein
LRKYGELNELVYFSYSFFNVPGKKSIERFSN